MDQVTSLLLYSINVLQHQESKVVLNYNRLPKFQTFRNTEINSTMIILPEFDWDDIALAGGAVLSTLLGLPIADLDLLIFGTIEEARRIMNRGHQYFSQYEIVKYQVYPSYIEIIFKSFTKVQLLYAGIKTPNKLVKKFDLDPCRCWYDGKYIWGRLEQVKSLITGKIDDNQCIVYGDIKFNRLKKYTNKGFVITRKYASWLGLVPNCSYPPEGWMKGMQHCFDPWHGCVHLTQWLRPYYVTDNDFEKLSKQVCCKEDFHTLCKLIETSE
jgi:hypothetical protein